jgi:hypothetical protein
MQNQGVSRLEMVYRPGDEIGYLYSLGLAALHPPKTEFVCLDCPRELIEQVADVFNSLADTLTSGEKNLCSNQCGKLLADIWYWIAAITNVDNVDEVLLDNIDPEAKLLCIVPITNAVINDVIKRSRGGGGRGTCGDNSAGALCRSVPHVLEQGSH